MRGRFRAMALIFLAVLLNSCGILTKSQSIPFKTIAQGTDLRVDSYDKNPSLFVITNTQEIDNLAHNVLRLDPLIYDQRQRFVDQLKQLDYSQTFAILVLQGIRGSGGYSVTVQQITRQNDQVVVQAKFVSPGQGEGVSGTFTDPYHLVVIDRDGTWGQQTRFELVDTGKMVAETSHFIP